MKITYSKTRWLFLAAISVRGRAAFLFPQTLNLDAQCFGRVAQLFLWASAEEPKSAPPVGTVGGVFCSWETLEIKGLALRSVCRSNCVSTKEYERKNDFGPALGLVGGPLCGRASGRRLVWVAIG